MPLPSWSKSHSHFVAFFLKAKLLTKAIALKGTSRSWANVKKFKIPKNEPKKPELSSPSTTVTYAVAMSSIHSSVSENKQEESTQSNVTNTSTVAMPTIHLNLLLISISRKHSVSLNVKLKTVNMMNWNRNKQNFYLTLLKSKSYFSLFLMCR